MNKNELSGKTILLVNAGSVRKEFIYRRMKELGLNIICLHRERASFAESYITDWVISDLTDWDACLKEVNKFLKNNPAVSIDGVVTFWEESIFLVSHIAETFNLVGIPLETAQKVKNKYNFRDECRKLGVFAPRHAMIKEKGSMQTLHNAIDFPAVIKPVYGAASAFVVKVNTMSELESAYASIQKNIASHELVPEWHDQTLFVEEYIDGAEVDIDIVMQKGEPHYITLTDNNSTNEPYFVETGETAPSLLPSSEQKQLETMAVRVLQGLGITDGCFHFEAKLSSKGAAPIEINMRMGGGDVYVFSKNVRGVDLIESSVKVALGIPVNIQKPNQPLKYLVSEQFLPTTSGIVKELIVDQALMDQPYFIEIYFQKKVGETFLAPPDGYDSCLGWLTVSGQTPEEARKNLEHGKKLVSFRLEEK